MEVVIRACSVIVLTLVLACSGKLSGGLQGKSHGSGGAKAPGATRNGGGGAGGNPSTDSGHASAGGVDAGTSQGNGSDVDAGTSAGNGGANAKADAGSRDSGSADAGVWPPAGTVAMFIVSGTQGRIVTSCDDGLTWKERDFPVTAGENFNEKGLAFGHGVFMIVVGWGGQCSFLRSEDGVNWQRLTLSDVGLTSLSECGGITYNGDGFTMVHWTGQTYASDHDGKAWRMIGMFDNGTEHVREIAGDGPSPGIVLAGGANDVSGMQKNPPHVSVDGGKTWKPTPGCSTLHAISVGEEGGGALGGGRMVYVGYRGEVCTSTDMMSWQETQIAAITSNIRGKVNFDGELFWAADASRVFVSSDGTTWTTRQLPNNIQLHAVARSNTGVYVGFNRTTSVFYRSPDGMAWTPATTSPSAGPDLYRIVYGYGKPSAECPLP